VYFLTLKRMHTYNIFIYLIYYILNIYIFNIYKYNIYIYLIYIILYDLHRLAKKKKKDANMFPR